MLEFSEKHCCDDWWKSKEKHHCDDDWSSQKSIVMMIGGNLKKSVIVTMIGGNLKKSVIVMMIGVLNEISVVVNVSLFVAIVKKKLVIFNVNVKERIWLLNQSGFSGKLIPHLLPYFR